VEAKVAVDNQKFSWVQRTDQEWKQVHQNGHSTRRTLLRLAFVDQMDRLVVSERSPEEFEGETIALTPVLC
jgi:hypothetical protein